jgi:S1-C subfamily serine protease
MKRLIFAVLLIIAIFPIDLTPALSAKAGGRISGGYVYQNTAVQTVCRAGETPSGDLGYSGTECHGCVISGRHVSGEPDMEFDSEPILSGIREGGPADGKLAERDQLVAIDGQPITTRAAAVQLSWLEPGKPVRLTVRRQGVLAEVEITPTARCRRVNPPRVRIIVVKRIWQ